MLTERRFAASTLLLLTVSVELCVASCALAQNLIPAAADFEVTGEITADQSDPIVLTTPEDGFTVLWRSGVGGLRGRIYDQLARPAGGEFPIAGLAGPLAAAGQPEAGFVIVGTTYPVSGPGIAVQRYSWATQLLWEGPVPINDRDPAYFPAIALAANGSFLVAWMGDPFSAPAAIGVFARAFRSDGVALGPGMRLNATANDSSGLPSTAAGSDGNYLVAWGAVPTGSDRTVLFARLLGADGQLVGPPIEIETETRLYSWPLVVWTGEGYVVAWTGAPEHNGVYGRRLTADGAPIGSEFRIDAGGPGYAQTGLGGFASLANGFLALWNVSEFEIQRNTIYGQRFDASGDRVGPTMTVNSEALSDAAKLTVAADSTGAFIAAWQNDRYPLPDPIVARRFVACGDGLLRGESCDDGNLIDGDGCDSNCTATDCGNGVQTAGEDCDDGNLVDGDGCSATCRIQATFTPTSTPTPTITATPRSVFSINGCVPEASSGCGFEFGTVHLEPPGRAVQVWYGHFVFEEVAPGSYTVTYSPRCNPFGCRPPVEVAVIDDDVFVQFRLVAPCPGDCRADGAVSVDELVTCLAVALNGSYSSSACDADRNGVVTIQDLIRAVSAALTGCPT